MEWIVLAIVAAVVGATIAIYNRLVGLHQRVRNAFAQIDVQLKRRYDLIPNLVDTAKGALRHERETLEAVIAARASAFDAERRAAAMPGDPTAMRDLAGAENGLGGALGRLVTLVESYPDLRANEAMLRLMEDLRSTENRIAFARQAFNDAVLEYETSRGVFPTLLLAAPLGFPPAEPFAIEDAAERRPIPVTA